MIRYAFSAEHHLMYGVAHDPRNIWDLVNWWVHVNRDLCRLSELETVFRDATDPILIEDLDGTVIDMNDQANGIGRSRISPVTTEGTRRVD